jgi:hypothetical protein
LGMRRTATGTASPWVFSKNLPLGAARYKCVAHNINCRLDILESKLLKRVVNQLLTLNN